MSGDRLLGNEMELLFQASRTSPILHEAVASIDGELRIAHRTVELVYAIATRGVCDGTTPEQALRTIAAFIEARHASLARLDSGATEGDA